MIKLLNAFIKQYLPNMYTYIIYIRAVHVHGVDLTTFGANDKKLQSACMSVTVFGVSG